VHWGFLPLFKTIRFPLDVFLLLQCWCGHIFYDAWNSGVCLMFMKWVFLHCSSICLYKENRSRQGFFLSSFI
jgi:hypothetical protein